MIYHRVIVKGWPQRLISGLVQQTNLVQCLLLADRQSVRQQQLFLLVSRVTAWPRFYWLAPWFGMCLRFGCWFCCCCFCCSFSCVSNCRQLTSGSTLPRWQYPPIRFTLSGSFVILHPCIICLPFFLWPIGLLFYFSVSHCLLATFPLLQVKLTVVWPSVRAHYIWIRPLINIPLEMVRRRECTHFQLALPSCPLLSHCHGFCCFLTKFWHWLHILFFLLPQSPSAWFIRLGFEFESRDASFFPRASLWPILARILSFCIHSHFRIIY